MSGKLVERTITRKTRMNTRPRKRERGTEIVTVMLADKPGGGKGRRSWRRDSAQERQKERDTLTPQQQLKRLDAMLGKGQGAKKERSRLKNQITTAA